MLVDQTLLQHISGATTASIDVGFSDFPHPPGQLNWDVMEQYGPDWLYIAIVLNFVIQLTFVVMEKEKKLRAAMAQMGLNRGAYWLSWFLACTVINVAVVLFLCGFGAAIQMEFFLENSFDVYFTLFFLTTTSFTLLAFFFSTLISTTDVARSFGIFWYIMTFISVPVLTFIYFYSGKDSYRDIINGLGLINAAPYYKGVLDLVQGSSGGQNKGYKWDRPDDRTSSTSPDIEYAAASWDGSSGGW